MNQILVSEKLYVTPGMKRKKKFFKIEFILSIFLLCLLYSYCIYAKYDRDKWEAVSTGILDDMQLIQGNDELADDMIVVVLNSAFDEEINIEPEIEIPKIEDTIAKDGTKYHPIGQINIPKGNMNYPILSTTSKVLLKIAPCKFWGADPNEVGNLCIVGHNYRDNKFFSKVPNLEKGDTFEVTDLFGKTLTYVIYDKFIIEPDDLACTSQKTNNERHVTLITCTNSGKQRWVIQAREQIKED